MMATKQIAYTPGPWGMIRNNLGCKQIHQLGVEGDGSLFTLNEIGYTHGLADEDQDQANADLISAAPDLLAALERMVFLHGPRNGEERDAERQAKYAIAKAYGITE